MSDVSDFDFIVLGAGNAGLTAAGIVSAAGQSILVIESREVGGTCPLRGCVPKKVLVAAAETLQHVAAAPHHHIQVNGAILNWERLIERKQTFVEGVAQAFEDSLRARGIQVIHGLAQFVGPKTVSVNGRHYRGRKILIATGSRPRTLAIPGFEHTITSDDILEMKKLPRSIAFIGGGAIAFEFAHVLARAGVKVTIMEVMSRVLTGLDEDVVKKLVNATRSLGVEILTDGSVQNVVPTANGREISFVYHGATHAMTAEVVANGSGRVANTDALGLRAAGVQVDHSGIIVDEFLRSVSNNDIFAAGDVLATPQLSAVATYEGRIVGHNVTHDTMIQADYTNVPSVVFTAPALASVGLTESAARQRGAAFRLQVNDMRDWRSARTYAETEAYSKVLVEEKSDSILGAHILGHGAAEIIHVFALAMRHGIKASVLASTVYAYPTFASDIKFLV